MRALIRPALIALLALAAASVWPQPPTVGATNVTQISAGGLGGCVVTTAGGAKCWGGNFYGEGGNGNWFIQLTPVDVIGLSSGVSSIEIGGLHACGVTALGGAKCWGWNDRFQLGAATKERCREPPEDVSCSTTPLDVVGLSSGVSAIGGGGGHNCALLSSGGVKCWGSDEFGQLGNGNGSCAPPPCTVNVCADVVCSGVLSNVVQLESGWDHACAIVTGGNINCWGNNDEGQLGDGSNVTRPAPVPVNLGAPALDVSGGAFHTCAVDSSGGVRCWGLNHHSQLGATSTSQCGDPPFQVACSLVPVQVPGLANVAQVAVGREHTCVLTDTGGVKCWGSNEYGQLGAPSSGMCGSPPWVPTPCSPTPVDVVGLTSGVAAISTGSSHTCALISGGSVKCWGQNGGANLGDGSMIDRPSPVSVLGLGETADTDRDGCMDSQEQGTNQNIGGRRNRKEFWDFFDVPTPPSFTRDRRITIGDLAAVISRFGSNTTVADDPLATPPPAPAFHIAYDRTFAGPELWKTGGPNGSITIEDIVMSIRQFGHSCA